MELIDKDALIAEIERRKHKLLDNIIFERDKEWVVRTVHQLNRIILFLDTLEVHHVPESVYVVTRSEEHSDYVEAVFLSEDKAEEYCKPFNEDENCYARNITKVKIQ